MSESEALITKSLMLQQRYSRIQMTNARKA